MAFKLIATFCSLWMVFTCILPSLVDGNGIKSPNSNCKFTLVESIPEDLTYPKGAHLSLSTYAAHKRLLSLAVKEIDIASFYWTLQGSDTSYSDDSDFEGEDIFKSLQVVIKSKKAVVKIAQNKNMGKMDQYNDTDILAKAGAEVRTLDFPRLMHAGILHTKMWIVDNKHLYVGSANFDWRSYTQVKETGILIEDCEEIVSDAGKIFDVYWYLGQENSTIPKSWPAALDTNINMASPLPLSYNSSVGLVYLSSSPPPFCPSGRTGDIDAILNVIFTARKFIYISVMDYLPLIIYQHPETFWPIIDDALRKVAYEKKIKVYMMPGCWKHTNKQTFGFLKTLDDLSLVDKTIDVQVKYFTVPIMTSSQAKIPYGRVNHSKFMVTDQHAYIGTSNWSGDYFISTGGVGFILEHAKGNGSVSDLRQQLEDAFIRDWSSKYASRYCKTEF